jgi:hypothetical protein
MGMNKKVGLNCPAGRENTRPKRLHAVVADQFQELESVVEAHVLFSIMAGFLEGVRKFRCFFPLSWR